MAYVQDPTNPQDEEEKKSKFQDLLQYGPSGAEGAPPAPAPAAASGAATPSAGAGKFVSFDKYLSANRGTVNNYVNTQKQALDKADASAQAGLKGAQDDFTNRAAAGTVQGPNGAYVPSPAAPGAAYHDTTTAYGTQKQAIDQMNTTAAQNGGVVTAGQAHANGAQTYQGPTDADVSSKYADLLSRTAAAQTAERNAATNGVAALNPMSSFDSFLINGGAGDQFKGYGDKANALDTAYTASSKAAGDAVKNATDTSAANAAAWENIGKQADADQATTTQIATDAAKQSKAESWDSAWTGWDQWGNGKPADTTSRPKGSDIVQRMMSPGHLKGTNVAKLNPALAGLYTQLFDRMSDDDLKTVMQDLVSKPGTSYNGYDTRLIPWLAKYAAAPGAGAK